MKDGFNYECGRDTEEVTTPTYYEGTKHYLSHDTSRRVIRKGQDKEYKYIIDPNIKAGRRITSLSELKAITEAIYTELGFESPVKSRIDICFDDFKATPHI